MQPLRRIFNQGLLKTSVAPVANITKTISYGGAQKYQSAVDYFNRLVAKPSSGKKGYLI